MDASRESGPTTTHHCLCLLSSMFVSGIHDSSLQAMLSASSSAECGKLDDVGLNDLAILSETALRMLIFLTNYEDAESCVRGLPMSETRAPFYARDGPRP